MNKAVALLKELGIEASDNWLYGQSNYASFLNNFYCISINEQAHQKFVMSDENNKYYYLGNDLEQLKQAILGVTREYDFKCKSNSHYDKKKKEWLYNETD